MSILAMRRQSSLASARVHVRVGSTTGDTTTDRNGVLWMYKTESELPFGKIKACTDKYAADLACSPYFSRTAFGDGDEVDVWIDSYAAKHGDELAGDDSTPDPAPTPKSKPVATPVATPPKTTPPKAITPVASIVPALGTQPRSSSSSGSGPWLYVAAVGLGVGAWWFLRGGL